METKQITPFFHLLFPLQLFVTFIFALGNSQNSFSCGPLFCPFWSVKYLNFGQKLPFQTTYHTFLESRQRPEVTKNPYDVLSPEGIQKKVSAHGLIPPHSQPRPQRIFSLLEEGEKEVWGRGFRTLGFLPKCETKQSK